MIKQITHRFNRGHTRRSKTVSITIHHSDSHDVPAAEIHRWHLQRGWYGIGYHYVIRADGSIETGRPDWAIGAHAGAAANSESIGICLTGRFAQHKPAEAQMKSLVWLIKHMEQTYGKLQVKGHKDYLSTSCPGILFPWDDLKKRLEAGEVEKVKVYLDGKLLPEEGLLHNKRTYLPVRALENKRYIVDPVNGWDEKNKIVRLRSV